jgi:F-type H+-transporting ATPase subunit gamma
MHAMQLVSGSKLKRSQNRLMRFREVAVFLDELVGRLLPSVQSVEHPLCGSGKSSISALVLFTSDTGLCGSYNNNLIQFTESYLKRDSLEPANMIYVGKKGHRYFTKRGFSEFESYLGLAGRPDVKKAQEIATSLMGRFLSGEIGSIKLIYSKFLSVTTFKPVVETWLPIQISDKRQVTGDANLEYIFEPSVKEVFDDVLPRWAISKFQIAMLEAFTSEHSARMIAMKNATENAEELLSNLTLQRNKMRQASITKELSEIVGTVEALK